MTDQLTIIVAIGGWKRNRWQYLSPNTVCGYEGEWAPRPLVDQDPPHHRAEPIEVERYFRVPKEAGAGQTTVRPGTHRGSPRCHPRASRTACPRPHHVGAPHQTAEAANRIGECRRQGAGDPHEAHGVTSPCRPGNTTGGSTMGDEAVPCWWRKGGPMLAGDTLIAFRSRHGSRTARHRRQQGLPASPSGTQLRPAPRRAFRGSSGRRDSP